MKGGWGRVGKKFFLISDCFWRLYSSNFRNVTVYVTFSPRSLLSNPSGKLSYFFPLPPFRRAFFSVPPRCCRRKLKSLPRIPTFITKTEVLQWLPGIKPRSSRGGRRCVLWGEMRAGIPSSPEHTQESYLYSILTQKFATEGGCLSHCTILQGEKHRDEISLRRT